MDNQLTAGLGSPQKISPVPIYRPQLAEWYNIQQLGTTNSFSVTGVPAFDSLDYRVAKDNFVKQSSSYAALLGQARPNRKFTAQLRTLQQHYTILDDDRPIIELLKEEPALYTLLIEAIKPLQHAFGEKRIVQVRVQSSDEDSILKVAVQLPADFRDDPERALQSFDQEWWLNNCHRSDGALVFDYEIQDAI